MMNHHQLREPKQVTSSQDIIQIRSNMPTDIAEDHAFCIPISYSSTPVLSEGLPGGCRPRNFSGTQRGSMQVTWVLLFFVFFSGWGGIRRGKNRLEPMAAVQGHGLRRLATGACGEMRFSW